MSKHTTISEAMFDVQSSIGLIERNMSKPEINWTYASYDQIMKQLGPILVENEILLLFNQVINSDDKSRGMIQLELDVEHVPSGNSRNFRIEMPLDMTGAKGGANKTPIQGHGSTIKYCKRYLVGMAFNLVIDEDDDGVGSSAAKTKAEDANKIDQPLLKVIQQLIRDTQPPMDKVMEYLGVDSKTPLKDLTMQQAIKLKNALRAKAKE